MTGRDGNFQIVIPAGPGHLLVRAATPDYLHLTTNNLELGVSSLPIWLMYPDALAHTDLKPDETLHEITMRLRRGLTVAGRVIGPDGNPVAKAIAFGRTYVPYRGSRGPLQYRSMAMHRRSRCATAASKSPVAIPRNRARSISLTASTSWGNRKARRQIGPERTGDRPAESEVRPGPVTRTPRESRSSVTSLTLRVGCRTN